MVSIPRSNGMVLNGVCADCRKLLARTSLWQREFRRPLSSEEQRIVPESHPPPPPPPLEADRENVTGLREEGEQRHKVLPIGSRRRRAALRTSQNVPFEQLPYQCFQEARKVLQEDRQEKLKLIEQERGRIQRLIETPTTGETALMQKETRLGSMRRHLEWLKIQADINDPLVKKKFEDGKGDMSRPIYRFLAERKWRSYKYLVTNQRITQMNVVPDILPSIDITADVSLYFHGVKNGSNIMLPRDSTSRHRTIVQPGEFVASKVSEHAPLLEVQVFDKGTRLITVAVVDPDVPNVETDGFTYRLHFLAANIPISPTSTTVLLSQLDQDTQLLFPWSPPYAQKGGPYHRLAVLVFQQPADRIIDVKEAAQKVEQHGFIMRRFADRHALRPIGAQLFRTQWDEWMDDLMQRLGVEGAGEELKRKRIEPLPYKKKDGSRYR